MNFIIPFAGLVLGYFLVSKLGFTVPFVYANYLAVAVLATIDSLLGGWRAGLEHRFDKEIFLSGFFVNAIAAGLLAFFGDQLGVSITMAATIVFGIRIFNNLSVIRTNWILRRKGGAYTPTVAGLDGLVSGVGSVTTRRVP